MAYLHESSHSVPIWALRVQDMLWQGYQNGGSAGELGISALPSMHVATSVLMALVAWPIRRTAGIASFCPYNIGPGKCFTSTFYRKLNAGDHRGACAEIKRWVRDGGKDCNIRSNNCYGQIERRAQESELTCWGLDE